MICLRTPDMAPGVLGVSLRGSNKKCISLPCSLLTGDRNVCPRLHTLKRSPARITERRNPSHRQTKRLVVNFQVDDVLNPVPVIKLNHMSCDRGVPVVTRRRR